MVSMVMLSLLATVSNSFAIGEVAQQTQRAQITREADKILTELETPVKMDDDIETLNGTIKIVFVDDTKVALSEYSKLKIDEFVYDDKSKTGKLSIKGKLGSLRYSSGLIAKNSRKNVKIASPTASVSVRGTDFTMTVDAAGRSTFKLLPSVDANGNVYVGSIEVSNAAGSVLLNQAYQVTRVDNNVNPPTKPVKGARVTSISQEEQRDKKETKQQTAQNEEDVTERTKRTIPGVFTLLEDGRVGLYRKNEQGSILSLRLEKDTNATINHNQGGGLGVYKLNGGNSVIFNIEQ
tara:strand:- start:202 stop:1080 length:879 start_codon:yes stop_codon:yes gene_type:complete